MVRRGGEGVGLLKVIQQFGQAARIPEKEPSHHRLKSRGPPVEGGLLGPGSPPRSVASPPHEVLFLRSKVGLQLFQRHGLGIGLHPGHHPAVQFRRATRCLAAKQALMQFPNSISQPGQLESREIGRWHRGW